VTVPSPTFFHAPAADRPDPGRPGLIGVPFDALSTERRGSAEAPAALRRASHSIGRYRVSTGQTIDWPRRLVDLGDVETNPFDPYSAFAPVRDAVARALDAGGRPICIGGDHALTYAAVTAAAAAYPDLRLVQIDAHHDATDPDQWHCRYNHGTFVRNLIEDGRLAGPDVIQVGVRDFQWRDSGGRFLRDHGARRFAMADIDRDGLGPALDAIRAEPQRPTYLTFDIDSLDPAYAPGTGEHMTAGLTAREATRLIRELFDGSIHLVAADLVELVPALDATGRTVSLAAHLLALMADGLSRDAGADAGADPAAETAPAETPGLQKDRS
jgi:agmatinase